MKNSKSKIMPLVAVVTPVHNGGAFLDKAMKSVQDQNYSNLIHIVLDNASIDKTAQIIEQYKGGKVPILATRNQTLLPLQQNWNAAANLIPKEAQYFYFLSADDAIAPDFIRLTIDLFERKPTVGVVCTLFHINNNPTVDAKWPLNCEVLSGLDATKFYLKNAIRLPGNASVFKRSSLDSFKPFFNPNLYLCDLNATMQVLQKNDLGLVHADLFSYCCQNHTITTKELDNSCRWDYEWMYLLHLYGPSSMSKNDFEAIYTAYQKTYYTKLFIWRLGWNRKKYNIHITGLKNLGMPIPTLRQLIENILIRVITRLKKTFKTNQFNRSPKIFDK